MEPSAGKIETISSPVPVSHSPPINNLPSGILIICYPQITIGPIRLVISRKILYTVVTDVFALPDEG